MLDKIRTPEKGMRLSIKVRNSVFVLMSGIILGAFSKCLDNTAIDDTMWWKHILGILDLRNVFSMFGIWFLAALVVAVYSKTPLRAGLNVFLFFAGMCMSYHLYTVLFCGFNPKRYMMIWYTITLLSPLPALACWYAKGKTRVSLMIDILILTVMMNVCFSFGFWYFDFNGIINTLIFAASLIILYSTPKNTLITLSGACILAFALRLFI